MSTKKKRNYTAEFKAKVALCAMKGDITINEVSSKYGVHSTQINRWKNQALGSLKTSFSAKQEKAEQNEQQLIDTLYKKIGELSCENEFLKKSVWK